MVWNTRPCSVHSAEHPPCVLPLGVPAHPCASPCLAMIPCSLLVLPWALPSLPASAPGRVQAAFWKEILWINGNILLLFHIITLFVKHRLQRYSRCWTQSSKSIYISQSILHYEQMGEEKKAIKTNNKKSNNDSNFKTLLGKKKKFLHFFKSSVRLNELHCKCIHPLSSHVNISRQRKNCFFSKWLPSRLVPVTEAIIRNLGEMSGVCKHLGGFFDFLEFLGRQRPWGWEGGWWLPWQLRKLSGKYQSSQKHVFVHITFSEHYSSASAAGGNFGYEE